MFSRKYLQEEAGRFSEIVKEQAEKARIMMEEAKKDGSLEEMIKDSKSFSIDYNLFLLRQKKEKEECEADPRLKRLEEFVEAISFAYSPTWWITLQKDGHKEVREVLDKIIRYLEGENLRR